ncbi:hypothetical protein ACO2Q8_16725 [Larkinella sp. VNQ87]|uniref:hypothetical protein n=1 Tax=Larkinella sp. VNQ87 TaxID=3400921 RepID=UPI003C124EE1
MNYLFTAIEMHPDKGFGITAESYFRSAEHLRENKFEHYEITQQAEMPQNFLYRHSIELYLKSLIIIFHKELQINYPNESFESDTPEILIDGKLKKLYTIHYIDKLYEYWLNFLLLPNIEILNEIASKGDWREVEEISILFPVISKYDQDSSYFRYPITKNSPLDNEKYTMQKFKSSSIDDFVKEVQEQKTINNKPTFTLLIVDGNNNITDGYKHIRNTLVEVRDALQKVAHYFYCIHTMTRITLCKGF